MTEDLGTTVLMGDRFTVGFRGEGSDRSTTPVDDEYTDRRS